MFWMNQIFDKGLVSAAVKLNATSLMVNELKEIIAKKDEDCYFMELRAWVKKSTNRND